MHWDGTITFGNALTILTTLVGLVIGGFKIAVHLQRSSDAMNNMAAIIERMQQSVQDQDARLSSLEKEQDIQKEVSRRMGHLPGNVVQVNK